MTLKDVSSLWKTPPPDTRMNTSLIEDSLVHNDVCRSSGRSHHWILSFIMKYLIAVIPSCWCRQLDSWALWKNQTPAERSQCVSWFLFAPLWKQPQQIYVNIIWVFCDPTSKTIGTCVVCKYWPGESVTDSWGTLCWWINEGVDTPVKQRGVKQIPTCFMKRVFSRKKKQDWWDFHVLSLVKEEIKGRGRSGERRHDSYLCLCAPKEVWVCFFNLHANRPVCLHNARAVVQAIQLRTNCKSHKHRLIPHKQSCSPI